ncbi:MAG: hypothetical protein JNL96_01155 [Planctomycetaceae bacterium]|nr:hypothetical protein [Planctomycetaceae bacterium]
MAIMDIQEYLAKTRNSFPKRRRQVLIRIALAHIFVSAIVFGSLIFIASGQPIISPSFDGIGSFLFGVMFFPLSLLVLLNPFGLFQNSIVLAITISTAGVLWGYVGSRLLVCR